MTEGCSSPKKAKMVTGANGDAPPVDSDANEENKDMEVVDNEGVDSGLVRDAQEAAEGEKNAAQEEEKPVAEFSSELVDFSRPLPQASDCVAVLKGPNVIAVGFPILVLPDDEPVKKISKPFHYAEAFNGGRFNNFRTKMEQASKEHVYLLGHVFNVDNKVILFKKKDEGTANAKNCKPKPVMLGIVTAVKQTADIRILNKNGAKAGEEIVRLVDLTGMEQVRTVNHHWDRYTVVFGNVMGQVKDCLFRCRLRDPDGRRLDVTASCMAGSKNGVYISHVFGNYGEEEPIIVGDCVNMPYATTETDVKQFIEFLDGSSPADYVATAVEFIVEEMEMIRIQIVLPSGSLPELSEQTSPTSTSASPSSPLPPIAISGDLADELADVVASLADVTSQIKELVSSNAELANIAEQFPGWLPGQMGKDQGSTLWIEQSDLDKVNFLPEYGGNNTTLYNAVLDGDYSVVSPNDYNSLLVNELKGVFSGGVLTTAEPLNQRKDSFKSHKCIVQVIRRRTYCDVRWYDGSVAEAIPSYELCHYNRVAHHTERLVQPGLLTTRRSSTEDAEKKSKDDEEAVFSEFGLINTVREYERMMTVRWFRKNPSSDENAPKYLFVEEERTCTYDYSHHIFQRFPRGSSIKLKVNEGKALVDVIGTVVSDSDDGYQVVKLLNGVETKIWPGEANLVGVMMPECNVNLLAELGLLTGSSSSPLPGIRARTAHAKKSETGQCDGGSCEVLWREFTKSKEKKKSSRESLKAYAALRLVTYPKPPCQLVPKDNDFEFHEKVADAQMFIRFFLNRPTSDKAEFARLNQKHPSWDAHAHALFAINENLNLSELALSMLGHLHETTPRLSAPQGMYTSYSYDVNKSSNLLIFPANEKIKARVDELLGDLLGKLSYLAPSHFSTIGSPEGMGICHVHFNDACITASNIFLLQAEIGQGVIVASESDADMMDHFMQTQLGIHEGKLPPERLLEDNTRFYKERTWNYALKAYQNKTKLSSNCEDENISLKNLTFDFKKLAEKMGLAEDPLFSDGMTRNSKADVDAIMFTAPFVADDKIPLTLKLEVATDCSNDDFTDTHLAFHALSQILTSPTWPTCTITVNKHMFADNMVGFNFVRALLILRKGNLLSTPYFNYAKAKILERKLVQEFLWEKGELTDRLGTEVVEELCKITKKMTDTTCIPLWKRLNAMEEFFSTEDIVSQIRHIISNPQSVNTPRLTSISSLNDKIASVTNNVPLQVELKSWIQEESEEQSLSAVDTFLILEKVVPNHQFIDEVSPSRGHWMKILCKEYKLLQSGLVEGMHVVTYEDRTDLFRAVIVGPPGTPYEGIPFLFDIQLPPTYPSVPPLVHYHSYSMLALHPNLYREGKVCLSLLGTWPGQTVNQSWDPVKSSVFQVVFSIHSEILMTGKPLFKEPVFGKLREEMTSIEAATHYNGQVFFAALENLVRLMRSHPDDVAPVLIKHFKDVIPGYLQKVRRWIDESEVPEFPITFDEGLFTALNRIRTSAEDALQKWVNSEVPTPVVAAEPARSEQPSQAVDLDPDEEKRTLFSEGDPLYVCNEYKVYVLERLYICK